MEPFIPHPQPERPCDDELSQGRADELESALAQTHADLAAGRFVEGSAEEHVDRLKASQRNAGQHHVVLPLTKTPKGFDKPDFGYGIKNSYDMFLKLLYEGHKIGDECEPYDCFNFFVTAWHLFDDWLPKDINRPTLSLEKKGRTPRAMSNLMLSFKDLTNGSKHMTLKESAYKVKTITDVSEPIIGDWLSYFTNTPRIYITIENSIYSMWDVRFLITHYFSWLFDDNASAKIFPDEVSNHLKRCENKQ